MAQSLVFPQNIMIFQHLNYIFSSSYICNYCGKGWANTTTLNHHIRSHTNEKPYSCKICNKSFISAGSLAAHVPTHATVKNYEVFYKIFLKKLSNSNRKFFSVGIVIIDAKLYQLWEVTNLFIPKELNAHYVKICFVKGMELQLIWKVFTKSQIPLIWKDLDFQSKKFILSPQFWKKNRSKDERRDFI